MSDEEQPETVDAEPLDDTAVIDEAAADAAAAAPAADATAAAEAAPDAESDDHAKKVDFKAASAAKAYSKTQNLKPEDFPAEGEGAPAAAAEKEKAGAPAKPAEPDFKAIAQRVQAEFDNYRKRVARERQDWQRDSLASFLKGFLPAFDDLDRTLEESKKNPSVESVCEGVAIARKNLWKTLEGAGITEIDAKGKKFDVKFHEALSMLPLPGAEPNTVVDVVKPGYMLGEFVVRPAQVIVAAEAPK